MSSELKPCPFCGGDKLLVCQPTCRPDTPYNPTDRLYPLVRCLECYAEAVGKNEDYRGSSAVEAWNRRTNSWASIETAPRTGSRVLCWNREWQAPESGCLYGIVWAANGLAADKGGWKYQPTHWMPLPAPPTGGRMDE